MLEGRGERAPDGRAESRAPPPWRSRSLALEGPCTVSRSPTQALSTLLHVQISFTDSPRLSARSRLPCVACAPARLRRRRPFAQPTPPHRRQSCLPAMQPSLLYARPQPPSDVTSDNFQWGEDAASTIAPEDSVSNLDRRFTGKRRILGPRAMDASSPAIPEEDTDAYHVEALRDAYVEPERIRSPAPQGPRDPSDEDRRLQQQQSFDDRTTAAPTTSSGSYATRETGAVRAVNPSTAGARGRGGAAAGLAPVPYASATASAYDEDDAPLRHAPEDDSRPLVSSSGSGYRAGPDASAASRTVAPYLPRSQSAKGYAVLGEEGHDGDAGYDDEPYEAYKTPRSGPRAYRDEEAAHSEGAGDRGLVTAANSQGLVGALSNPFGYIKQSWRGRDGGQQSRRQESFYPPDELAFDPPKDDYNGSSYPPHVPYTGSASYHHPTASLDKIPSLDVVPPQDGFSNRSPYYNPTKAGPRGEMIEPAPLWRRWVWDTTDPERRVWEHRTGRGMQRWPFASWTLAVIMTAVRRRLLSTLELVCDAF